jgi:hypothetical protein
MLFETCKSALRASVLISFVCLAGFPVQGQIAGDKPSEEELGVEYLVQLAEMPRYMAHMVGTYESPGIKDEDDASIFDFELIYAYRREKQGKSSTRFERTGRKITSSGHSENYDERRLKTNQHDWIQEGNYRRQIVDAKKLLETVRPEDKWDPEPSFIHPLYLPLHGPNAHIFGNEDFNCNCAMPIGQLYNSASLGNEVTLGVWITGDQKEFANVIQFDGKQGGMPTQVSSRMSRPGKPPLDKCDPIKDSDPFDITKTKWKKHEKSGYWLPTEIESAEVHRYHKASYEVKIYWWIDDEVPDEVFEFEDFKKAVIRRSKAHEMIKTLKDSLEKKE